MTGPCIRETLTVWVLQGMTRINGRASGLSMDVDFSPFEAASHNRRRTQVTGLVCLHDDAMPFESASVNVAPTRSGEQ